MTQHVTLEQLKEIEKEEYETLTTMRKIESEALQSGDMERYQKTKESTQFSLGRWGIISELIEQIEKLN